MIGDEWMITPAVLISLVCAVLLGVLLVVMRLRLGSWFRVFKRRETYSSVIAGLLIIFLVVNHKSLPQPLVMLLLLTVISLQIADLFFGLRRKL